VDQDVKLLPEQDEYPVWYFFYGTLAYPVVLRGLLGKTPTYQPAKVDGGILKTWGGKYKALVDAHPGHTTPLEGYAFLIRDRGEEDILQCYETDKYEVVRCEMEVQGLSAVRGLTFRFIGEVDL